MVCRMDIVPGQFCSAFWYNTGCLDWTRWAWRWASARKLNTWASAGSISLKDLKSLLMCLANSATSKTRIGFELNGSRSQRQCRGRADSRAPILPWSRLSAQELRPDMLGDKPGSDRFSIRSARRQVGDRPHQAEPVSVSPAHAKCQVAMIQRMNPSTDAGRSPHRKNGRFEDIQEDLVRHDGPILVPMTNCKLENAEQTLPVSALAKIGSQRVLQTAVCSSRGICLRLIA